jgi:hypothetical protein
MAPIPVRCSRKKVAYTNNSPREDQHPYEKKSRAKLSHPRATKSPSDVVEQLRAAHRESQRLLDRGFLTDGHITVSCKALTWS